MLLLSSKWWTPILSLPPHTHTHTQYALNALGTGEFFPNDELLVEVSKYFCDTPLKDICGNVLFLICGFDRNNLNEVC